MTSKIKESIQDPLGIHLDSRWSPYGLQMDFIQNGRLGSFTYGLQVESRWNYGLHLESTWNLWGRVKYSILTTIIFGNL
jgi:hypothetical protein